ncbi:MAG: ribonuclease P protein component [Patescibacteria group bacterium]|nr:ribonuclease P protein component [Patescibacteria group bacterium]
MLPKPNRLTKKKDFERVFKKGKGFKEDFLILKFVPNNLNRNRIGIVVSLKISKKATLRNRIKRQIRELVRLRLSKLITLPGKDIVLIALPGLETKDFWEIEGTINKLFEKAGILGFSIK